VYKMGRYSSWWSRLLIIGIVAAVITPVGIYAVPQLQPYLNLMPFYEDPDNTELRNMILVDSDVDASGEWTWCLNRLDILMKNPLDAQLRVPKADASVRYFGGRLGDGYIAQEYLIEPKETKMISMYLYAYNYGLYGELFSRFVKALFWGQDLTLNVDINAYILIDGVLNEPLIGLKFPMTIKNPLPFEVEGWDPLIYDITSQGVGNDIEITVDACDPGTGLAKAYVYYKVGEDENWDKTGGIELELDGLIWDNYFHGIELGTTFPIASSYADQPIELSATITGLTPGQTVAYYIYLEDYAGNWKHEDQGNYFESEVLTHTAGDTSQNNIAYDPEWEDPFIIRYLEYMDTHGINMQHYLYMVGINLLKMTPMLNGLSQLLYAHGVDADYFLAIMLIDFVKGLRILGDSGVAPGVLMDYMTQYFDFSFDSMLQYAFPRVWYPFENDTDLEGLADYVLNDMGATEKGILKAKFDAIGITNDDLIDFIDLSGVLPEDPDADQFRTINAFEMDILGIVIRFQGSVVRDWDVNPSESAYDNWLDLIRTGNETNGHWAAATCIMFTGYAENPPVSCQEIFPELLGTELSEVPEAFPANDLYPYTHQLVSLVMLLCLGIVSYLVLKREILIHRKVERGLAAKKKMQQKAVFDKDAKNKAQSKYL